MAQLQVLLRTQVGRSFVGHRVTLSYGQTIDIREGGRAALAAPGETTVVLDASGQATLNVPGKERLSHDVPLVLRVFAPDGQVLLSQTVPVEALDGAEPLSLSVDPKKIFPIERNTDPAFLSPSRVRGLVVDPSGRNRVGGLQVILGCGSSGAKLLRRDFVVGAGVRVRRLGSPELPHTNPRAAACPRHHSPRPPSIPSPPFTNSSPRCSAA